MYPSNKGTAAVLVLLAVLSAGGALGTDTASLMPVGTTQFTIDGSGFFIVQDTTGVFFTRVVLLHSDSQGRLVNEQGQAIQGFGVTPTGVPTGALGAVALPLDREEVLFDEDGLVSVVMPGASSPLRVAQIALANFPNPYGLSNVGTNFVETIASGTPVVGSPNQSGLGSIQVGSIDSCERQLDICVYDGPIDLDGDGVLSAVDGCPDTPLFTEVDDAGCSQSQACTSIELHRRRGLRRCLHHDWRNDAPLRRRPRDCTLAREYDQTGLGAFRCVSQPGQPREAVIGGKIPPLSIGTTQFTVDGDGFFIVQDTTGVFYTRAWFFRLDTYQILVNEQGQAVQGFGVTPTGVPSGALGSIALSTISSTPQQTSTITVNVNLDPNDMAPAGDASGFDHLDPVSTTNFQTGTRIFDSLGNPQNILVYFRKNDAASNSWFWYAGVNRGDVDFSGLPVPFNTFTTASGQETQFLPLQSGTLSFDSSGALTVENNTALSFDYDQDGDGAISGAEIGAPLATPGNTAGWAFGGSARSGQLIAFDFGTTVSEGGEGTDKTTQYGGAAASGVNSFVRSMHRDGFTAGSLQSIWFDEDGFVNAAFSNEQTQRLSQIALAIFPNPSGLRDIGASFVETPASGNPIIGAPNQGGFGAFHIGFLDTCERELEICVETGSVDVDGDGVPFAGDRCRDTLFPDEVDEEGCSAEQFCALIEVDRLHDALRCLRSDWRNDEPLRRYPRDCTLVWAAEGQGWEVLRCVAR